MKSHIAGELRSNMKAGTCICISGVYVNPCKSMFDSRQNDAKDQMSLEMAHK